MKKVFTLILALTMGFGLKAQCPLTTAVDFTATDCHGTEVHLFDILDGGQYVLIDFFYTTCGPCQQATPKVVESYYAMGCNQHDVYYMEITCRQTDTDEVCQTWCQTYGVEYPTISGPAGGVNICNQYGIPAYPTVILIAPDRQIVIQDLWPINNAQTIISALEAQGLEQHDCNSATYDPQVTVIVNEVTETTANVTFIPNEDCATYYYNVLTEAEMQTWMNYYGISAGEVLQNYGFQEMGEATHDFQGLEPQEEYFVWVVPTDINGTLYEVQQVPLVETPIPPDYMPDFIATDIDGNEIHLFDILDAGQTVLLNLFLRDGYSAEIMPYVVESYQLFGCNQNDVFFIEICPQDGDELCRGWAETYGVKYPTISRDGGGNDIAQSIPVAYYPTVIIVNPDHTYAYRDLYPIEGTFTIVNALEGLGCEQHECLEETLTFSSNTVNLNWCEMAYITIYNNTAVDATITNICDERYELGFYIGPDSQEWPSCNVSEFTIPQGGFVELGIICCVTGRSIVPDVVTVTSNLPETQFVVMVDDTWSVDENEVSATLFPNPANDFVTLKGEDLGTVRVYNALGQKMDEFEANGSELRINTTRYENGVYFVKTDEQTMKFVVKH